MNNQEIVLFNLYDLSTNIIKLIAQRIELSLKGRKGFKQK